MPGLYTEPDSRSAPENDPTCNPSLLQEDASGDLTPSYEYQVTCPNDQNLIYVQGRAVVGDPPEPPLSDRQGIPAQELGPCVRCNLQIEGTGPKPEDVILDAGTDYRGHGAGGEARRLRQARRPASGPRRWLRRAQLPRARGAGAHLLQRGGRRHPARPREVLLGRRLRPPLLHLRSQPRPELRGARRRRRGRVPGRRSRDRLPGDGLLSGRASAQHRHQGLRPARLHARLLGLDGQRRPHHQQPHLRQHAPGSRATPSRPPVIPASRPTARRSTTTTSTRTTSTSTPTTRRSTRWWECRSGPGSSTPA